MSVSIIMPPAGDISDLEKAARGFELVGVKHIWVADHVSGGRHFQSDTWLDAWQVLACMSKVIHGHSSLGTMVSGAGVRPASTLALQAKTFSKVFPKFTLGVGAGAQSDSDLTSLPAPLSAPEYKEYVSKVVDGFSGRLLLAANLPSSLSVVSNFDAEWVTNGSYKGSEYSLKLLGQFRSFSDRKAIVIHDASSESPWSDKEDFLAVLGAYKGFDEVCLFVPHAYATTSHMKPSDVYGLLKSVADFL